MSYVDNAEALLDQEKKAANSNDRTLPQSYKIHAGRMYISMAIKTDSGDWIPPGGYQVVAFCHKNDNGAFVLHRLCVLVNRKKIDIPWFGRVRGGIGLLEHVRLVPEIIRTEFDGKGYGPAWCLILQAGTDLQPRRSDHRGRPYDCSHVSCVLGEHHGGFHMSATGDLIDIPKDMVHIFNRGNVF